MKNWMGKGRNAVWSLLLSVFALGCSVVWASTNHFSLPLPAQSQEVAPPDSVSTRFPVKPTQSTTLQDAKDKMLDLKDPVNISQSEELDEKSNNYIVGTKIGSGYMNSPMLLTPEQYKQWTLRRSMHQYYAAKNREAYEKREENKFDFSDMHFNLGPAEKIFGPGGVQLKSQGSAEIKVGISTKNVDNPSLPIRNRKITTFDFDEQLNLGVNGKIGDKMDLNLNYNTEATFDFDTKSLKLQYQGKEDEIVKLIEGGNVSFPTTNSLIQGSSSLFGVRADFQFGKLKLQTVVSQKKGVSKSVSSKGGEQLNDFEIAVDNYEANRHFFLSHFFRDQYDQSMSTLPNIVSGITINRIEVWVTNKNNATTNTRNIIGFTDLGEGSKHIGNPHWTASSSLYPSNQSNTLYSEITGAGMEGARQVNSVFSTLSTIDNFKGGIDYEKLESARMLNSNEYSVNSQLGYISLKSTLQTDQVLAVAFEYTYRGQTFQVGEFSTDRSDNTECLFVKTLKNATNTPGMSNWDLMMKNVYSLGASNIEQSKFRLDVKYLSDTTGVYLNYFPEERFKQTTILKMMGLDRLDNKNQAHPNGYFDFVEGYTIDKANGRIFFPSVEPFGKYLAKVIGDQKTADQYVYQELYDSTKTIAKQIVEKNKFILSGQYKGSGSNNVISLGAVNVPRGSVIVTAGGITLTENVDYSVNYSIGEVTILNQSILDAGTPVSVSLESTGESLQRKTLLGVNWEYDFTKNFILGGTLMHLNEQSLTTKVAMGSEPLNNTIFGLNLSWKKDSQWLTDLLDKIPFIHLTQPSNINFTAEFAKLFTGSNSQSQSKASYIDDFENTKSTLDISVPSDWVISSCPQKFTESSMSNDIQYGFNRSLMSWYTIDPMFTRRSSSLTPSHIKSDIEQLSNHYVREVYRTELFPNKELTVGESSTLNILNVAYYPNERGPYNLNPALDYQGKLKDPAQHWGGMMRALETTDFETANIEYLEFWMLDPFIYSRNSGTDPSGDIYFNLGDISEDILKDGNKAYESGMSMESNNARYIESKWGKSPQESAVTYAFNTSSGARSKQDVGLDGLTSEEEKQFDSYKTYLNNIRSVVAPQIYDSIAKDPAGDDYHYFRGTDYDTAKVSILNRYKRINHPEGNSVDSEHSPEKYSTAYKTIPDAEDINKDYTLNEYNNYYEYKVRLSPDSLKVGNGYIVDKREAKVALRNGTSETVNWYLFRIPLAEYKSKVGNISDFSSIRFMRMYLTNFQNPIVLRFGTLELVRGEWRNYELSLSGKSTEKATGTLDVAAVNIQENNTKTPVNYILPPGISPVVDRTQSQLTENNEQALNITVKNLPPTKSRAVYKNYNLDLRQYKHIQMFTHANALTGDLSLKDQETSIFIRLGSDYKNNYYEYEIPLKLTPAGHYDRYTTADCKAVWPEENMLDIDLSLLTNLKKERNKLKSEGRATYSVPYCNYDPNKPSNKMTVMGNPSLGNIRTVMIGVRNNSYAYKDVEVWVNELRLQNYTQDGGYAAKGRLDIKLSDLASLNVSGHIETAGFGGIEQGINDRRNDNLYQYNITTNFQLGKLFPEKAKVNIPVYYSYNKQKVEPKYNPLDCDMTLDDALDALPTKFEKDSLSSIVTTTQEDKNFSISNAHINIASKRPMPYDPANFSFSYAHTHKYNSGETTVWETDDSWKFDVNYDYAPDYVPLSPFAKLGDCKGWTKILQDFQLNWLPQSISIGSNIMRTYYELQERDMETMETSNMPLNFSSDFLWNRNMAVNWDITNDIHATINMGTNAEVQEPYTPVNKSLYPDEYTLWKDSVWHSIKHFGTPLSYAQNFNLSWNVPINSIPIFSWINANASYDSSYNWERGTTLEDNSTLGNVINNNRNIQLNATLNMEDLYNKIPFLKKVNEYYSSRGGRGNMTNKNRRPKTTATANDGDKDKKKGFEQEIQLNPDSTIRIMHNLKSRKLKVKALRPDGKRYMLKYKVNTSNSITILSKDSTRIKLAITPITHDYENQAWFKATRFAARTAMMLRNISLSYSDMYAMNLPGFMPSVGDFFGQKRGNMLSPGLDFAFGLINDNYITRAKERGWLLDNDSIASPATSNQSQNLQISAVIEPFKDFKIDLNASHSVNKASSIFYNYAGMPTTQNGSFNMTTISIKSAFEGIGDANNGYQSKSFSKFVGYLAAFRDRVEAQYKGTTYPQGSTLAGKTFDPALGAVSPYSSDVMIPAFLAAYCGGGTDSPLDIFPKFTRMLPNWSINYGGLSNLALFKSIFKSFSINHAYKSVYAVGGYNTYSSYMAAMGAPGFITDASQNLIPSSRYDISSVSLNESFSPLIGVSATLRNDLTLSLRYNQTRVLNLSMTSTQLTEAFSKDIVLGFGYKVDDLKLFRTPQKSRANHRTNKRKTNSKANNPEQEEKELNTPNNNPTGMKNTLNLRFDFSFRDQSAINRNIISQLSQATSGNKALKISFNAEYTLSKLLTLSMYFDRQTTTPLLTSSAYPTTTQDFGFNMRFSLAR